jgi:tetratricopeptide (TPR) repeat protein
VMPQAKAAVRRALELDADLAEAHASMAMVQDDRTRSIRALERAVELRPSYAEAHNWLSWNLQLLGRAEDAHARAQRAVELDPLSPEAVSNLALTQIELGQFEQGLVEARRNIELQPEWSTPRFFEGLALHHMGEHEDAVRILDGVEASWAGVGPQATRALSLISLGDEAAARGLQKQWRSEGRHFAAGLIYAACGELEDAMQCFAGVDEWDDWEILAAYFFYPDVLSAARDHPEWQAVIKNVRLARGMDLPE